MNNNRGGIILLTSFLLFLFSCAESRSVTLQKPQIEELKVQSEMVSKESWQIKWDNWIKIAKNEKRVTIYGTMQNTVFDVLKPIVLDKYGIPIEVIMGRSNDIAAKILAQERAGIHLADVFIGGPTPIIAMIKPEGYLVSLNNILLLPEILEPKSWWKGELDWADKDHMVLAFFAYPLEPLGLNTTKVTPKDIQSYRDLLNPQWKGKIVMNDPTITGSGSNWVGIIGRGIMGIDFLREFARQEPVIIRDERLQIDWLAQGKYYIATQPKSEVITEFINAGAALVRHTPVEGGYLTSGSGTVAIFKKAPHPNASRVFVNWLLTKEGQTFISKAYGAQSGRIDVTTEHLPPGVTRVAGRKYLTSYTEDYVLKNTEVYQIAREIYGPLTK